MRGSFGIWGSSESTSSTTLRASYQSEEDYCEQKSSRDTSFGASGSTELALLKNASSLLSPTGPRRQTKIMMTTAKPSDYDNDLWNIEFNDMVRAGRARSRSEASRPRGRTPRIRNQPANTTMTMQYDKSKNLPSQVGRISPSGRRLSPMVPEAHLFSPSVEPTPLSPTGKEYEMATVENYSESDKDPLDLTSPPHTFVDCQPSLDKDTTISRSSKRKAKTSPIVITPSNDERSGSSKDCEVAATSKGKRKSRRKRVQLTSSNESLLEKSADMDDGSESEAQMNESKTSKKRKSKSYVKIVISSDEDEAEKNFAPQDLRIMSATNVGSLGLDCLASIERMRAKSRNIQGGVSGKMRKELERAKEVMNTLIYKSEAIGDPTFHNLRNKEITEQLEKYKREETLRNREIEDLRGMVEDLKKEVIELRGRLDDAEEEERKAKASKRITEWKLRKLNTKDGEGLSGPSEMENKGTETEETMFNLPVDGKPREKMVLECP